MSVFSSDPNLPNPYVDDAARVYLETPCTTVYIAADRPQVRAERQDAVNHWRIWFVLPNNAGSINLDMVKSSLQRLEGTLGVIYKPYALTSNRMIAIEATPMPGLTVKQVLDYIIQEGRLRYRFTPSVQGCTFWVETVTRDMEENGWIRKPANAPYSSRTVSEEVTLRTQYFYMTDPGTGQVVCAPFPSVHGTFFS